MQTVFPEIAQPFWPTLLRLTSAAWSRSKGRLEIGTCLWPVLYIPAIDLIRPGGKLTGSGIVIVSRPIPFKLVREIWFCVRDPNDLYAFGISEKILEDYELEDEVVMEYLPSLVTIKYRNERSIKYRDERSPSEGNERPV